MIRRREFLAVPGLAPLAAFQTAPKTIAAIITEYRHNSHADVIAGRLLEGYDFDGRRRQPRVKMVSMYTDQVPANDMSRAMAAKHAVAIKPTIAEALTLGTGKLAVDGVVLIGEHGNYPTNEKGQKLYPRYELFSKIVEVFRSGGRSVPVFTDKHLSVEWKKAKWMYDQSRELGFPLMAGSSLPVTWRRPPVELEKGTPVRHAVAAFYGGKEAYGFHALEALQCMVERRQGGETGISQVHAIEGSDVWKWTSENAWAVPLLESAAARSETRKAGPMREVTKNPVVFVLRYRDGLEAAVYMLNGYLDQCVFATSLPGRKEPLATEIWLQPGRPFSHFSALTYYIEELVLNGKPPYPVERTLLTTGALAALMDSSYERRKMETPHLDVKYQAPEKSLFSRGPVPPPEKAKA